MTKSKAGGWLISAGLLAVLAGGIMWSATNQNESSFGPGADHTPSWVMFGLAAFLVLLGVILVSGSRES